MDITPGTIICTLSALLLAVVLIWPPSRNKFSELLDRFFDLLSHKRIAVTSSQSPSTDKPKAQHTVAALVAALNQEKPTTKDEIRNVFTQVFGEKILPNIMQDYDVVNRESWLIRFYHGAKHIKIGQTEKGIWHEK